MRTFESQLIQPGVHLISQFLLQDLVGRYWDRAVLPDNHDYDRQGWFELGVRGLQIA